MKKIAFLLLLSGLIVSCKANPTPEKQLESDADTLNIATYNVRIRTGSDKNEKSWANRKSAVAELIKTGRFDVVGVQELIDEDQEKDLTSLLPGYDVYSVGRDNQAGTKGERLALYYGKDRFRRVNQGYFFLSETPEKVSRGWDAALNRICIWVHLYDSITDNYLFVFNAHFDHLGTEARAGSAALLVEKMKELTDDELVVCMGDFNASPFETAVYSTLSNYISDARTHASNVHDESRGTYTNWVVSNEPISEQSRIDYIFTNSTAIVEYRVHTNRYLPDAYPSDHFPVSVRLLTR